VETRLRALVADIVKRDPESFGRDDDLVEAYGIDSLQGLQLLATVEKRFDIRLRDEELIEMRSIRRIAEAIEQAQTGGVTCGSA
jgi:acyl carrier protein